MRIFATKWFSRWAGKQGVTAAALRKAVDEIRRGLIDADLGGHVVKKRVALAGRGKRGGARVIVAFHMGRHTFFVYGYAKNTRDNIDADELAALQALANELLGYSAEKLSKATEAGELDEVSNHA